MEMVRGLRIGLGDGLGVLAAASLFLAGLWSYFKQSPFILGLFLLPGVTTVVAAVGLQRPIFPRFLFFLIGFGLLIVVRGALAIGGGIGRRWGANIGPSLVVGLAVVSVVSLIPNYRYPKQDFGGAMRFVDQARSTTEPVATVGLATDVYRDYYQRGWPEIRSVEDLQNLRARGERVWVLYTLEGYIEMRRPEVMQTLRRQCANATVFRGTLGNGDVTVCVLAPVE
jgi:hypothetical protein